MSADPARPEPTFRCPRCTYDVTRTLADAIDACPECGGPISEHLCRLTPYDVTRTGGTIDSLLLVAPTPITLGAIGLVAFARLPLRVATLTLLASVIAALVGLRVVRGAEHWSRRNWASLALTLLVLNASLVVLLTLASLVLIALFNALGGP